MGTNSSTSNDATDFSGSLTSKNSYFGSSPPVDQTFYERHQSYTTENFNEKIIHEDSSPQQLKSVVSITNYTIRVIDSKLGIYSLTFDIQSEAPGRLIMNANNQINSLNFDISTNNEPTSLGIPLPSLSNFTLEISPDLENSKSQINENFVFISHQTFRFEISDSSSDFQIYLKEQRITTINDKLFSIPMNTLIPIDQNINQNETDTQSKQLSCLICMKKTADTAIADCGHLVICDDCLCKRSVRLHHCPICNKPTTF